MDILPIIIGLLGLIALDLASLRWGVNSIEAPDSVEWERRRSWRGFVGHR